MAHILSRSVSATPPGKGNRLALTKTRRTRRIGRGESSIQRFWAREKTPDPFIRLIGKFDPAHEQSSKKQFDAAVRKMKDQLAAARPMTTDPYVLRKIYVLEQDAELMGLIYAILSEEAGYQADRDEARKDRVRELIRQVRANEVVVSEDRLRHVLKSLDGHVKAVLGAKY